MTRSTPGQSGPKGPSLKAATDKAIAEVDGWPGEFGIHDVIKLSCDHLGLKDQHAKERVFSYRFRTKEWLRHLERMVREWANVCLRKRRDEYGLRVYVCYRIKGKRRRHWLRLDNLTIKTLDALTQDRDILVDDIQALRPYLTLGRAKMAERGSDVVFGDVKADVVRGLGA